MLTPEYEFENLLAKLLENHPRFKKVERLARVAVDQRVLQLDIRCIYHEEARDVVFPIVIEVMASTPLVASRVLNVIARLREYARLMPGARPVLATLAPMSDRYRSRLEEADIRVWDPQALAEQFSGQLEAIKGSPLYALLARQVLREETGHPLTTQLQGIAPGKELWPAYQAQVAKTLDYLFVPPLMAPIYETSDSLKVNRRDIILPNYSTSGFWRFMREKYSADFVVVDAKNGKSNLPKSAVLQVANYLKETGAGLFGMILLRSAVSRGAIATRRELWLLQRKMILFLTDDDLIQMIRLRDEENDPCEVIRQRIEEFRLGL